MQLHRRGEINSELKFGLNVTQVSYLRHENMADINFYTKILDLLARDYIVTSQPLEEFEENVRKKVILSLTDQFSYSIEVK